MAKRGRKLGTKFSDINWLHVTIYCKQSQWDRMEYLSADSNKTLSAWVINKALSHKGSVSAPEKTDEQGIRKSLCVPADKWEEITEKASENDMSVSKYVLAVCLK